MKNRQPDFGSLRKVLLRQGEPDYIPFIELFADREIMEAVLGERMAPRVYGEREMQKLALDQLIRFYLETGYDYVPVGAILDMPHKRLGAADTAELKRERREWVDESSGMIESWQDFESFPWPAIDKVDFFALDYVSRRLPEGMKIIFEGPGGQLENIMWLMGYVPMGLALADDRALVQAMAEKVGELLINIFNVAVQYPAVGAIWLGDDMGFKTSTMISPADLREFVFPWQKKLAAIAHAHNMPFMLHSCGNLTEVMDDLIDDVRIDAKHSFEDAIQPVAEAKKMYGNRVALLGGVDVDVLCRASEAQVRSYTRRIIEQCAPGGGWALGTGNTVANYIPVRNYLAMLDEGRKFGG